MKEPVVAIVGRPNVGKSTFINRVIGARKAIVDDLPGITRDRSYYKAEWCGKHFTLVDTGGLVPGSEDFWEKQINAQVDVALLEADALVFIVDGHAGITALDEAVADRIRRTKKPVFLAVNKIDTPEQRGNTAEFYQLGLGDPYPVSAMHGTGGVGDLLDVITESFPKDGRGETDEENGPVRIAIVGKPNAGKSSLLNALVGNQRVMVSEVAGTTRDAIDVDITFENQPYVLVDTAGIRKKGKVDYGVEMFSVDRAIRSLRQSDVTIVVMDAVQGVTDQDKKIMTTSNEAGKGLVLVMNKWDLVPEKTSKSGDKFIKDVLKDVPHAKFAKVLTISAVSGQRITKIFNLAREAYSNNHRRVKTSLVNQVLMEAFTLSPPPPIKNKRLKLLYATQVGVGPPTFVLFVNDDKLMKESYKRYLEGKLRESFDFTGTPIVILVRGRERED